jgi:hypothetical protein
MSIVEFEFNQYILAIRTKRASIEILKYKYNIFKKNAKFGALQFEVAVPNLTLGLRRRAEQNSQESEQCRIKELPRGDAIAQLLHRKQHLLRENKRRTEETTTIFDKVDAFYLEKSS